MVQDIGETFKGSYPAVFIQALFHNEFFKFFLGSL